jgi:predicted RNase H-like HicB family nuclease
MGLTYQEALDRLEELKETYTDDDYPEFERLAIQIVEWEES